jgi:antitoxin component of RelBE/YafQ-DinJ toxin-antitoxin module
MIGKGTSTSGGAEIMGYSLDKDKSEIIDKRHIIGDNAQEIKNEFRVFQNLNHRCKNNDISFVLSPEPKDGRRLTNQEFKEIADDFLKKMGLDKNQAIVLKHVDTKHAHLHIIVNRIDTNGKAYNDSEIGKKSSKVADQVAQDRNLTRSKVVEAYNKAMQKDIKAEILIKHKAVLQHKPKDFQAYKDLMKSSGVKVVPTINKANKLQGFRVEYQGFNFKASEIKESVKINGKLKQISPLTLKNLGVTSEKIIGLTSNLNPALKVGFKVAKAVVKGIQIGY